MRKTVVIAVREYKAAVRTKAFIVSMLAMPLLIGGSIVVQEALSKHVDVSDQKYAIVDRTPDKSLATALAAAADERNQTHAVDSATGQQLLPKFLLEDQSDHADLDELRLGLSGRVTQGELDGFLVITGDPLSKEAESALTVEYHSNRPTNDDFRNWAARVINDQVQALRLNAASVDAAVVHEAIRGVRVAHLGLVQKTAEGKVTAAEESNQVAGFLVPFAVLMLMFMVVMVGASPLVNSVLEEKMQRISEVLLGSVSPFELMMGKLLGTAGVSLTIGTIYLVGAYLALDRGGFAHLFPAHLVWWFIVFQGLAVLMFGSIFISVGAAVNDLKEAQSAMMPVMIIVMVPLFVWMPVLKNPTATSSLMLSLFPPATPMLMMLRLAVPPGLPAWQPLLGIVITLATTLMFVYAAGRIFRVGILLQGKAPRPREVLRWVFRG